LTTGCPRDPLTPRSTPVIRFGGCKLYARLQRVGGESCDDHLIRYTNEKGKRVLLEIYLRIYLLIPKGFNEEKKYFKIPMID
jgi:hypothetical protein